MYCLDKRLKYIITGVIIIGFILAGGLFAYKFREPDKIKFNATEYKNPDEGIYIEIKSVEDANMGNLGIFMVSTSRKTKLEIKSPGYKTSIKAPGFNTERFRYDFDNPADNEMKINVYKKFLGLWIPDRSYLILLKRSNLPKIKKENFAELCDQFLSQFENIGYQDFLEQLNKENDQ